MIEYNIVKILRECFLFDPKRITSFEHMFCRNAREFKKGYFNIFVELDT